jgi:hypothetical protein
MAIFPPDDPAIALATRKLLRPIVNSHTSGFIENVKRNPATAGSSQARDVWGKLKFSSGLEFQLAIANIELMMSFYEVYRVTGFTAFDFEQYQAGSPGYRPADPLGTGDGSTTTFTIPAKEVGGVIVYDNAGVVAFPAGYSISVGTGAQGEDRIVFAVAPVTAHVLTIAYLGRRRYTCEIPAPPGKGNIEYNRQRLTMQLLQKF